MTTSISWRTIRLVAATASILAILLGPGSGWLEPSVAVAQMGTGTLRVSMDGIDGLGCGSASQPCRNIQFAANQAVSGDTILVAAGTYTYDNASEVCQPYILTTAVLCLLNKELTVLGGYSAGDWSTPDPAHRPTIIDGQNTRRGVLLQQTAQGEPAASLHMEGFTIRNGLAQGTSSGSDTDTFTFGGGMLTDASPVVLRNLVFQNNKSIGGSTAAAHGGAGSGGGLALRTAPSGTSLESLVFDGNEALGGTGATRGGLALGGGLFTYQSVVSASYLTLTNNLARAGSSNGTGLAGGLYADAQGGGAAFQLGSVVTLQWVSAVSNSAVGGNAPSGGAGGSFGGGLMAELATLVVSDSDLRGNVSRGGDGYDGGMGVGGGLETIDSAVTLDRVSLLGNRATGGVGNPSGQRGPAGGGGAHLTRFSGGSTVGIYNSVISGNRADMGNTGAIVGGGGGGLWLQGVSADLAHLTLWNNQLGCAPMQGQAVLVLGVGAPTASSVSLSYTIIADHTNSFNAAAVHVQPGNSLQLLKGLWANNTRISNTGDGPGYVGTITGLNTMVAFASAGLISPGVPVFNNHIRADSPARDLATGSTMAVDIDDYPRVMPKDIGADEYTPFLLTAIPTAVGQLLDWTSQAGRVAGIDHFQVVVSCDPGANPPGQGTCGAPINVGLQTRWLLIGLTPHLPYTSTVTARDAAGAVIATSSTVVQGGPASVFLPLVVRSTT